jgi:mono/diheme cytochrome c family protein
VRRLLAVIGALSLLALAALAVLGYQLLRKGLSARDQPTPAETVLARRMRSWAIPQAMRGRTNPVASSPEVLARARAHFADHCASCHGNDGRGQTTLGRGLYPKAPDMTLAATQGLSDGELFAIIENGVRLTGMPAWGQPGPEDDAETWELVQFIRHLPRLTPEEVAEMESLNPKSRSELEEEESIRKFLAGEEPPPTGKDEGHKH